MIRNRADTRRTRLGYPDGYHEIRSNLVDLAAAILKQSRIKATDINLVEGGYSNVNLRIDSSAKKYLLKISADEALPTEVYWYQLALKHGLSVPKVVHHDLTKDNVPFMYEIMEFVKGKTYEKLSNKELKAAGQAAGRELAKAHKIKVEGFGTVDKTFKFKSSWKEVLKATREQVEDSAFKKVFKKDEIELMDDLIFNNKLLMIKQPKFIHGDLWPGNALTAADGRMVTLLDPSLVGGDPMFDVGYATVPRDSFAVCVEKYFLENVMLTEEEKYRLDVLRLFHTFMEAADYVRRKDETATIQSLVRFVRSGLKKYN
jgi:fructosamine-3-kinase